ncbi:thiamine ABC transporter substrate-binding protein [Streptomyces oceani]|uniref:ABC transporter substrate-binding protein n=1 Tax=Streptomyces oceani TaxID=1075402 RepID=A0A1E7JRN7_9ACTN|nr:thiamine ABC transporter substrate-binding protein [Streptomyces oceani]OEU91457.1 ABC transporter substrate-binding protein [Streptomyces oceani]
MKHRVTSVLAVTAVVSLLAGCGSSGTDGTDTDTVTLVTHDSFAASKKVLNEFTERTGYEVRVLRGGDAGSAVNQAVLNKDNPQGDVFFGVDNTLLSRALDGDLFVPYAAKGLSNVPKQLRADAERNRVTPVDTGEICVNYDRDYFAERKLEPPRTFEDLAKPRYRDLLVTENAATSSPGLGFLLGTVREYGADGWRDYWKKLKANGVEVVDGWEQAYNDRFSGSAAGKGKGDRPLVVSYASSPPVEVLGKKERPEQAPTGVIEDTCFRQTEYAGLLSGAANEKGGKALLDFLLSKTFQEDLPLQMFVSPARSDVDLPELFTRYGATVEDPLTMAPERIAENRERWVDEWTSLVLR